MRITLSKKLDQEQADSTAKAEEDQVAYVRQLSVLGRRIATVAVAKSVPFDLSVTKQREAKTAWLRKAEITTVPISGAWNLVVDDHSKSSGADFVLSKSISPGKNLFCFNTHQQASLDIEVLISMALLFSTQRMCRSLCLICAITV